MGFNAARSLRHHRHRGCPLAGAGGTVRACAPCDQAPPCGSSLARLRFLARLSPARSDRTRARGALQQGVRPAILRPSLAGLLPRALERRRVRSLLDADADWADVELWPIALNHVSIFAARRFTTTYEKDIRESPVAHGTKIRSGLRDRRSDAEFDRLGSPPVRLPDPSTTSPARGGILADSGSVPIVGLCSTTQRVALTVCHMTA